MAFTKTAGVEYGTPAVVLSTTAASGSNQTAIRTDGQIIAFNTSSPSSVASSSSVGTSAQASRQDHVHDGFTTLQSAVVVSERLETSGSGDQIISGLGFTPTSLIMLQSKDGGSTSLSIGFADANDIGYLVWGTGSWSQQTGEFSRTDSNPNFTCTLKTLDADGFTLTWIMYGTPGFDVNFGILAIG